MKAILKALLAAYKPEMQASCSVVTNAENKPIYFTADFSASIRVRTEAEAVAVMEMMQGCIAEHINGSWNCEIKRSTAQAIKRIDTEKYN